MTKEVRMTDSASAFVIRAWKARPRLLRRLRYGSFLRHSSFVIRHFDHGSHRPTSKTEFPRAPLPAGDPERNGDHAAPFQKHAVWPDESDDAIPGGKMGRQPA